MNFGEPMAFLNTSHNFHHCAQQFRSVHEPAGRDLDRRLLVGVQVDFDVFGTVIFQGQPDIEKTDADEKGVNKLEAEASD